MNREIVIAQIRALLGPFDHTNSVAGLGVDGNAFVVLNMDDLDQADFVVAFEDEFDLLIADTDAFVVNNHSLNSMATFVLTELENN